MSAADSESFVARLFRKMRVTSAFGGEPLADDPRAAIGGSGVTATASAGVAIGVTIAPEAVLLLVVGDDAAAAGADASDAALDAELGAERGAALEAGDAIDGDAAAVTPVAPVVEEDVEDGEASGRKSAST